jgi:prepilin-type processing-associated H-X9-DG protein
MTLVEVLVTITIIGVLIALLLPAIQAAREAARRAQCSSHLRQVGIGLANYSNVHRDYLPALNSTRAGNPLSWRWTILPFLEQSALSDLGNVENEMDAVSGRLRQAIVTVYQCPSTPGFLRRASGHPALKGLAGGARDYAAAGFTYDDDQTNGYMPTPWWGLSDPIVDLADTGVRSLTYALTLPGRLTAVEDGLSNTVFVFEQAGKPGMYRADKGQSRTALEIVEPGSKDYIATRLEDTGMWCTRDWYLVGEIRVRWRAYGTSANNDNLSGLYSFHPGGANVLLGDASVRFLRESIDAGVMIGLLTREGGEVIPGDALK